MNKRELSYLLGFLQTDGHMRSGTRNRGAISIELSSKDKDILYRLRRIIPVNSTIKHRTRNTNFKKNYTAWTLNIFHKSFRDLMNGMGLPYGAKSKIIKQPSINTISLIDYWRGIIDGDGSLGITGQKFPFLSLVTVSKQLAIDYEEFLFSYTGKRKLFSPNTRDSSYNIMITKEDAQLIINKLYYNDCICINRKKKLAKKVLKWRRPKSMRKKN
jgi:hypothetical protein